MRQNGARKRRGQRWTSSSERAEVGARGADELRRRPRRQGRGRRRRQGPSSVPLRCAASITTTPPTSDYSCSTTNRTRERPRERKLAWLPNQQPLHDKVVLAVVRDGSRAPRREEGDRERERRGPPGVLGGSSTGRPPTAALVRQSSGTRGWLKPGPRRKRHTHAHTHTHTTWHRERVSQ